MSKHERFDDYPLRGLAAAESALLTVWPSLERYHDDLVLVGGLAVHCLTKGSASGWPGAVTMDVDLGISLGAGGDQYGTISTDLAGLGFKQDTDTPARLVKEVEGMSIYIDFLTEDPTGTRGSRMVDDIRASAIPGIGRALACHRLVSVQGADLYGVDQSITLRVSDIGLLLVLKLQAFESRRQPKDAYDVLLAVTSFIDGPMSAIEGFKSEADAGNPAFDTAIKTLEKDFISSSADGPIRAAEFLRGTVDDSDRIRQDLVTVAEALLGK